MLDQATLATLFFDARSHNGWLDQPVSQAQLEQLYDLVKWAPTSANCEPARIVFVQSDDARARLAGCMAAGNADKVKAAPVTAIIGMDMAFLDKLPELFPHADARSWFAGNQPLIDATAFRNSSMQGGYFILAARALGLDVGPMSGFDADKVDAAFFEGTTVKVNFVCSIGHGDVSKLFDRSPRLPFEDACSVI
ncbi:MAG: 3-hydroxypropanoate dehydrogenase [Candidatus Paceibacteria bacterium]|jgi:3-hydroxypropanoate dehydrogenase